MLLKSLVRRLPVGAEVQEGGGVHFRVWAPRARLVEVILDGEPFALTPEAGGYHAGFHLGAGDGTLYAYRLDGRGPFPDPASRFQPDGPHAASEVVDPGVFAWTDAAWRGATPPGQVFYEMHLGTFTPEGTWESASHRLPDLRDLGVTTLEVMPVADFHGRFGWGYDGVDLYAPTRLYGRPDDFRRFVDQAHALGLAVILDVVYNHLGPEGNYLPQFAESYFNKRATEWGDAINFDGPDSGPVREFFTSNAGHWISEYHLDGLRLDATHAIHDSSGEHIVASVQAAARRAAGTRTVVLVAENESQDTRMVRPPTEGGCGLDAAWNDDFHHTARVALTGRREAYYSDYLGSPQELISAVRRGFLYQGLRYEGQKKGRGTPCLDLPATAFVHFLENHDQVANSAHGARLAELSQPGDLRAMTALLLLGPATPLLFQGQEYGSPKPFLYFADMPGDLAARVWEGRRQFLRQFPSLAGPEMQSILADPGHPATFERCKLDAVDRGSRPHVLRLHRDLLALRRDDAVFRRQAWDRLEGGVLGERAFALRFLDADGDRLILANLGVDLSLVHQPEPLLAPPRGREWHLAWSSEDPAYGGSGVAELPPDGALLLPGHAALVLTARPLREIP